VVAVPVHGVNLGIFRQPPTPLGPRRLSWLLFDTWLGLSVRLIAGNQQEHAQNASKPGIGQRITVELDCGLPGLYPNGQLAK